ncbi:MAG: host-nuclease inhibitor Gam family protein [Ignavibacteriales bacterium]|nr:host-nuclease inhibitor Gam family protein [Ignavibacteriales bacterium]
MENQTPSWLQELLDQSEAVEEKRALDMNKILADRALAAISALEAKVNEVNAIAEQEVTLISSWQESEIVKLQKKIDWLAWNLEGFMKSTGEKTLTLPHGQLKLRMGRDKVEVVDFDKFLPVGKRLGLLRHIPEKDEPDLVAIAAFVKLNGKPPVGIALTPAQSKFSYKTQGATNGTNSNTEQWEPSEVGASSKPAGQVKAA